MKKLLYLLLACVLCGTLVFTACSKESQEQSDEAAETTEAEVTQEQIEKNIIGTWIKYEIDGQPALTNEKSVIDIVSITDAYTSASHKTDDGNPFDYNQKSKVEINGNAVTISTTISDEESLIHEFSITDINDSKFTANRKFTRTLEGSDPLIKEDTVSFVKINEDYGENIVGTWEGHCTSEGSIFDDGQDHRWEYKDDGTYVYYVKDGGNWVPSNNDLNEYFVAGNLLCTRWTENGEESHECWDITIDGDTMNWTALRENEEDGSTYTAAFEMKKVE